MNQKTLRGEITTLLVNNTERGQLNRHEFLNDLEALLHSKLEAVVGHELRLEQMERWEFITLIQKQRKQLMELFK